MSTTDIQLYAELLVNIRHVSISVTLPTPADDLTVAELLPRQNAVNGYARFRVQHHGAVQEMTLPGRVAMADRAVRFPLPANTAKKTNYLTWRLPVVDTQARGTNDDELAPWSAPDLQPESSVTCRGCNSIIIASGRIGVWKDLPSDNWAEMMEFWHCHKPEHKHNDKDNTEKNTEKASDDALAGRGYGANSAILAEAGVGFVDLITLMFAESDCQGLKFSESTFAHASDKESVLGAATKDNKGRDIRGLNVYCAACRAQIGYYSLRMQSVNVFKWQVDCQSVELESTKTTAAPTVSDCVAATLVATIARTGSSKSVILPIYEVSRTSSSDSDTKVLQIWVLNSGICYASATAETKTEPKRAIKLLYKYIDRAEADDLVVKLNSDVQEINLPSDTIVAVAQQLEVSHGLLPVSERAFKDWKIGLVERWR